MDGHFVSTQFFKRRRLARLVQRDTDGTATDTYSATSASTAGVSDVTVMIDKNPKQDDRDKGLPGEKDYSPTRGFGGCVLISRRRVAMPEGLPEEWTKAGGRCTLLRGPDGPDRGAYKKSARR